MASQCNLKKQPIETQQRQHWRMAHILLVGFGSLTSPQDICNTSVQYLKKKSKPAQIHFMIQIGTSTALHAWCISLLYK